MGFDFTLIAPLLPSHCGFSSVLGHVVFSLVKSSVFLSMIVQQPVVILVLSQEGVRARPSTLPSWLIPSLHYYSHCPKLGFPDWMSLPVFSLSLSVSLCSLCVCVCVCVCVCMCINIFNKRKFQLSKYLYILLWILLLCQLSLDSSAIKAAKW